MKLLILVSLRMSYQICLVGDGRVLKGGARPEGCPTEELSVTCCQEAQQSFLITSKPLLSSEGRSQAVCLDWTSGKEEMKA